ncbi:MAG: hypothetical protein CV045_11145, partial [Cyanobacteria bacterium M5B4]
MESLVGIAVGTNDRYLLQSLVKRSGVCFVYDALDRSDNSAKVVEIWHLELTEDQDEFLSRLMTISQVEDRRLVPIVDGGILVVPIGADILKELPYVVTEPVPEQLVGDNLAAEEVLTIGIKVCAILHRLHRGTPIRSRSGQIIGQVKLSHGYLSLDSIRLDPDSSKVILTDWYRYSLLERQFDPVQDCKDLMAILQHLCPQPPRSVAELWQKEFSSAKALGEELRACQIKLNPPRHHLQGVAIVLGILALPPLGWFLWTQRRSPVSPSLPTIVTVTPPSRFSPSPQEEVCPPSQSHQGSNRSTVSISPLPLQ